MWYAGQCPRNGPRNGRAMASKFSHGVGVGLPVGGLTQRGRFWASADKPRRVTPANKISLK